MKVTRCAFHQHEIIVNFCRNPECLLPMCSKCIKLHSIEHAKQKTHGIFDSINDISCEIENTLKDNLKKILTISTCIKSISEKKTRTISDLNDYLFSVRQKILTGVSKYLDGLDQEVLTLFNKLNKSYDEQFIKIDSKIDNFSYEAKQQIDGMNSDKKMKTIINHMAANMPVYYQQKLNQIENNIRNFQYRNIQIPKDLSVISLHDIFHDIKILYQEIFLDKLTDSLQTVGHQSFKQFDHTEKTQSLITKDNSNDNSHTRLPHMNISYEYRQHRRM